MSLKKQNREREQKEKKKEKKEEEVVSWSTLHFNWFPGQWSIEPWYSETLRVGLW